MFLPGDFDAIVGIIVIGFLFGVSFGAGESVVNSIPKVKFWKRRQRRSVGYK